MVTFLRNSLGVLFFWCFTGSIVFASGIFAPNAARMRTAIGSHCAVCLVDQKELVAGKEDIVSVLARNKKFHFHSEGHRDRFRGNIVKYCKKIHIKYKKAKRGISF